MQFYLSTLTITCRDADGGSRGTWGGISDEYSNTKILHAMAEAQPVSYIHIHQPVLQNAARCKRPFSRFRNQLLTEVGLCGALLLRCQCRSGLCKVRVGGLDEGLDGGDYAGCGLALESLGFESLDNEGKDLCGLGEDGLILSVIMLAMA